MCQIWIYIVDGLMGFHNLLLSCFLAGHWLISHLSVFFLSNFFGGCLGS